MRKPSGDDFEQFAEVFDRESKAAGKQQYIVPYFIASHPGSDLNAMIDLAVFLKRNGYRPDQVQDFIPAPFDVATAMFYTGIHPFTKQPVHIARHLRAGGINTEVQMEARKVGKQFQYASRAGIRFVVLAGEDELARGVVAVKDLAREQQFEVPREELAGALRVELEQARALAGR